MSCGAGLGRSFIARIALALVLLTVTLCFFSYRDLISRPSRLLPHAPFHDSHKQQETVATTTTTAAHDAHHRNRTLGPRNATLGVS